MKRSTAIITTALIAAAFGATLAPVAMADGWRHRHGNVHTRYYAKRRVSPKLRFYSNKAGPGPIRYYNVCGYGDCPCLRSRALATGSPVWWDRYQACTG